LIVVALLLVNSTTWATDPSSLADGDSLPPGAVGRLGTARLRHMGVTSVAYSPDGKLLASGGNDRTVRLWEVPTGKEVQRLEGHGDRVGSVVFAPDGKSLASASNDGTVRIWDVATGNELKMLMAGKNFIRAIAFSPDGKWLASAHDRRVKLWETSTWSKRGELAGHDRDRSVLSIAFSPDGKTLASASEDRTARVWDLASGTELRQLGRFQDDPASVAFAPDGKTLALGFRSGLIQTFEPESGKELLKISGKGAVALSFSPDGKTLAAIGEGPWLVLWDPTSGREISRIESTKRVEWDRKRLDALAFSPDGKTIALANNDTIRLIDVGTGQEAPAVERHEGPILAVVASPDGETVATSGGEGTVRLWDPATGKQRLSLQPGEAITSLAFAPDGKSLAGGGQRLYLWESTAGKLLWKNEEALPKNASITNLIFSLAFAPDGKTLAWKDEWGTTIHLADAATGATARTSESKSRNTTRFAISSDGKTLATGDEVFVRTFEVATGKPLATFKQGHTSSVWCVACSKDGKIASGGGDRTARLWDASRGEELFKLEHADGVVCVAFSPDGKTLATSTCKQKDGTIYLWDRSTGKERGKIVGHTDTVRSLAFLPNGKLVSGGIDATVLIWDPAAVKESAPR
jgi:WD40 repeat protein